MDKRYFTRVDEDGSLTIPQEVLDELGWGEGDELHMEASTDADRVPEEVTGVPASLATGVFVIKKIPNG